MIEFVSLVCSLVNFIGKENISSTFKALGEARRISRKEEYTIMKSIFEADEKEKKIAELANLYALCHEKDPRLHDKTFDLEIRSVRRE